MHSSASHNFVIIFAQIGRSLANAKVSMVRESIAIGSVRSRSENIETAYELANTFTRDENDSNVLNY